ncbi:uncharacterized protein LOC144631130 isoform X2 [Oculina patagonica]
MSNRGQSSVYDSRHKSWRGPILKNSIDETRDTDSAANPPLSSPTPRTVSLPAVTWTQPPMVDYRTRRSAFDFGRPSRIYRDDSEEMCHLRRRSHLLFDELERERQGNSQLRQEVSRLRVQHERVGPLVEEIDCLRRNNESLAREIQTRKEARTRSTENEEPRRRTVQRFSRF